jgi:DMSO/TMAO reductase YedYZ molybdopterin-dependent catalytic subunit
MFESSIERKQKEEQMKKEGRLPPHQVATLKWPVLHIGEVPKFEPDTWDFRAFGLVEKPRTWTYEEFMNLPKIQVASDFHCVTRWSRFDNLWEGIAFKEVFNRSKVKSEATHVMVHGDYSYTTNVPLVDLLKDNVLFAYKNNGENLTPEHGWPFRLIVPHLYGWKSAKWVRALEFLDHDVPGFWEQNGYHMYADAFKEQRYSDD